MLLGSHAHYIFEIHAPNYRYGRFSGKISDSFPCEEDSVTLI